MLYTKFHWNLRWWGGQLSSGWMIWCGMSRPALGPAQPPVQWERQVISPGVKHGRGITLTTLPHQVPRSRMSRSYTSSPPKHLHGAYWYSFKLTLQRQNPRVHHHIYYSLPPALILSQLDPPQNCPANLPNNHFHLCLCLPSGLLPLVFPTKTLYTFLYSHMPRLPHSPWLHLPNDIWHWV
jgi:hypothetical protein